LGFTTDLEKSFDFIYRSEFDNGLTEFEFDHVFTGTYDETIHPNPEEVSDQCFQTLDQVRAGLASHPDNYTAWFHVAFPLLMEKMTSR
jgi:isopentenyl-diphosphate delta-isomerase